MRMCISRRRSRQRGARAGRAGRDFWTLATLRVRARPPAMKRSRRKPNTPSRKKAAPRRPRAAKRAPRRALVTAEAAVAREIDAVRAELQQLAARQGPPRWNA